MTRGDGCACVVGDVSRRQGNSTAGPSVSVLGSHHVSPSCAPVRRRPAAARRARKQAWLRLMSASASSSSACPWPVTPSPCEVCVLAAAPHLARA
jgi:hypothetical protein